MAGDAIADREAKEAVQKIVTGQLKALPTISINNARKLSTEIALRSLIGSDSGMNIAKAERHRPTR